MDDFSVIGIGTALPKYSIDRKESVELVLDNFCPTEKEKKLAPALYRMAGVQRRHSVLLTRPADGGGNGPRYALLTAPKHEDDRGPTVGARMEAYEEHAAELALQAGRNALEKSGAEPGEITHLVTVSCSGFIAPGVDIQLMKGLGLPPTVERAHVGFMGCQGALNGMRVARGFAESRPDAAVLLCAVELCSLHYFYGWDPDRIVANALFADGAAAAVGRKNRTTGWRVRATGACLVPDSEDAMTWRIRDNGFLMSLSPRVPGLIEGELRPWTEQWLADNGLGLDDVKTWAVHPGGPRILSSVAKALDFDMAALEVSRGVLKECGNMSSPTILFILGRLMEQDAPTPCVALAFGPGLMVEAVLFDR